MGANKKVTWIISLLVLVVIVIIGVIVFEGKTETVPVRNDATLNTPTTENSDTVQVKYSDGTTTVQATFNNDPTDFKKSTVTFTEPTVGTVTLPVAISGSGARYANADESIVFWEHQGEATITKDGKNVFVGKIVDTTAQ